MRDSPTFASEYSTDEVKNELLDALLDEWRKMQKSNQRSAIIACSIFVAAGVLIGLVDLSLWFTTFYGV
jgi:uncharacterized transporter YbjL